MNISIKSTYDYPTTTTTISDGKNYLAIMEREDGNDTITTLTSNGDSIYPIMDLLKIWEATH